VSPDSVHGAQWPPQQQRQQVLQQLLLQRHQQRAPAAPRPPPAEPRPSLVEQPRKGSAPTLGGPAPSSAFRPVLTGRVADWSPSRRAQHEPRLPYFEVRNVSGADTGRRYFRPIADRLEQNQHVNTTLDQPDDVFDDSRQAPAADSAASVNKVRIDRTMILLTLSHFTRFGLSVKCC